MSLQKKAAVVAATPTQSYCTASYQQESKHSRTNLKSQLGEILFYLQRPLSQCERATCLGVFESLLCEYVSYEGQQL